MDRLQQQHCLEQFERANAALSLQGRLRRLHHALLKVADI